MNYAEAQARLDTDRRKRYGLKVQNNTRLVPCTVRIDGANVKAYGIKLHATVVIAFLPDGREVFNSGGWRSVTTKDRMGYSRYVTISQKNWEWRVFARGDWSTSAPYSDLMIIGPDGIPAGHAEWVTSDASDPPTRSAPRRNYHWSTHERINAPVQVPDPRPYVAAVERVSYDAMSIRFDAMNEDAEREMAEWDAIIKGARK